jgi:5-methylcytosine-specific restriction endonuclease McrA
MKAKLPNQADANLARARRLLHDHRTRAKRDGCQLDYALTDLQRLIAEHPLCAYCRAPVSFAVQVDHRTPIARGGRHQLANLAVCCSRCNALKGQLTEVEFRELLSFLAQHPRVAADLERRLLAGAARYAPKRRSRRGADFGPSVPE